MEQFSEWLAATALSQSFASSTWFVPAVQTVHILAIAVVVTVLVMLDFRLLRLTQAGPPLPDMSRSFLPYTWAAFIVLLITGILMIITEPGRELLSSTFWLKMVLVAMLVALTFFFQKALRRDAEYWNARRTLGAAIGLISLVLCIGIVFAGRLIAYI
jgi:hypothetical protein